MFANNPLVHFVGANWKQLALFYLAAATYYLVVREVPPPELVVLSGLMLFMHILPTLGLPFAAFANEEKVEKALLTYLAAPSGGILLGELLSYGHTPWGSIAILHLAFLAIIGYWSNSIMSRDWRWGRFLASTTNPQIALIGALVQLQFSGRASVADAQLIAEVQEFLSNLNGTSREDKPDP
jgi:hypothetical protein